MTAILFPDQGRPRLFNLPGRLPIKGPICQIMFQSHYVHGLIQLAPGAGSFAKVVTYPAADRGERESFLDKIIGFLVAEIHEPGPHNPAHGYQPGKLMNRVKFRIWQSLHNPAALQNGSP